MRSPVGTTAVGKNTQRNTSQTLLGKGIKLGNVFTSTENHNSSCPNVWTTSRWLERQKIGTDVEISAKRRRLGISDSVAGPSFRGLHPERNRSSSACGTSKSRPVRPNHHHTGDERGTTEVTFSSQSITAWIHDLQGHTEKCVDKYFELAGKSVSASEPTEKQCMAGHQVSRNIFPVQGSWRKLMHRSY